MVLLISHHELNCSNLLIIILLILSCPRTGIVTVAGALPMLFFLLDLLPSQRYEFALTLIQRTVIDGRVIHLSFIYSHDLPVMSLHLRRVRVSSTSHPTMIYIDVLWTCNGLASIEQLELPFHI